MKDTKDFLKKEKVKNQQHGHEQKKITMKNKRLRKV